MLETTWMKELIQKILDNKILEKDVSGEVFLSEDFESDLVELKELKDLVDETYEKVQQRLKIELEKYPELKSFEGDKVKISYSRPVDRKFTNDFEDKFWEQKPKEAVEFIQAYCKVSPDSKKVKAFIDAIKVKKDGKFYYSLPEWIEEVPRDSLTLRIKLI